MSAEDNRRVVERLWQLLDAHDFDGVGDLLHDDFVAEWPQSRERLRGRANYIAVNANYPGDWAITVRRVIADGDHVASEVSIQIDGRTDAAVSFYELRDGPIVRETNWWPEPFEPPVWRARWIERMN